MRHSMHMRCPWPSWISASFLRHREQSVSDRSGQLIFTFSCTSVLREGKRGRPTDALPNRFGGESVFRNQR